MEYTRLGKSDLEVSRIAFGCMSLEQDINNTRRILHRAIDLGINFFDTADLYQFGENEKMLGKAFQGMRDEVIISSKVGNEWFQDKSGWRWNPSGKYILKEVEESLKRLQTDYIDLYMLHGGTIDDPIDETIATFENLKHQGKIRYYGISSIRPNVIREYVRRSDIAGVMMQYSLLDRRPEESCLSLLKENSIGVLARGTLAKGLLVDKPAISFLNYTGGEVQKIASKISDLTNEKRSATQIALNFVLANKAITSAVVGIRTRDQLEEVVQYTQSDLKPEDILTLKSVLTPNLYEQHR